MTNARVFELTEEIIIMGTTEKEYWVNNICVAVANVINQKEEAADLIRRGWKEV